MNIIVISLKLMFFSIIGYYLKRNEEDKYFYGIINPTYALFTLISIFAPITNIILLFLQGIIWGLLVDAFIGQFDERLKLNFDPKMFGLLNIINVIILNPLMMNIFSNSQETSIIFIFIISSILFLFDFIFSLRKNI